MRDYSYIGVGKFYLRVVGAAAGLVEIGNASAVALSVTEDVKTLKNYTTPGGGTQNEVRRIDAVELAVTVHDLAPENLARALYGATSAISTAPVVDEEHTAYPGAFIPTNTPGTVTAVTGFTLGDDYILVPGGVQFLDDADIDYMGEIVEISYTPDAGNVIEALTTGAQEYEVFFAGLNEARSNKPFTVHGFRWKPGPLQSLGLISDDYAGLELTGKLLRDDTKDGVGESQYFKAAVIT